MGCSGLPEEEPVPIEVPVPVPPSADVPAVSGLLSVVLAPPALDIDLRQIGDVAPKGRVQDKEYNPRLVVVDRLIAAGPAAIPFLVSKLEDETTITRPVFDFWGKVHVGDVAFVILRDFFVESDWKTSTVPALDWGLLEGRDDETASATVFKEFVAKHGQRGRREKVERVLRPYGGRFVWDAHGRCFRPENR